MIQKMGIMGNIFRYLPNSIYGYDIAVKDALSAILRYGTFQSLVVFYDPRQYQEHIIRKIIKELQNRGQINAEIEFICMEYDDSIVRQMVECIKVYPGGKLEIIFGGGYLVEESV